MKPSDKDIKNFFKNAAIGTNPRMEETVLNKVLLAGQQAINSKKTRHPNIWRIIMNSKLTKLAVSAVVIISVILVSIIFDSGVKQAYAIDQTIEAMRKVTTVHLLGTTFDDEQVEIWIGVNAETGANERHYFDTPALTHVATPNETYFYDKKVNRVRHLKGCHIKSELRFGRFIEDMVGAINGKVEFTEVYDSDREMQVILLVIENDELRVESKVDLETRLPMSIHVEYMGARSPENIGKSIDEIYYDSPLPEGIFEFKIPEGAEVVYE